MTTWHGRGGQSCPAHGAVCTLLAVLMVPAQIAAGAVFTVTSPADSGAGTLRDAILQANANPNAGGNDRIEFAIPLAGVITILPLSALPEITDPVDIDGTTQPGYAGTPQIELNGVNAGATSAGLLITTSNCTVRGLVINRFRDLGLRIENGGGHVIQGNYIGTDAAGATALGNINGGLLIFRSPNNRIGGTQAGEGNVISGNCGTGLYLLDTAARSNRIVGNFIGTRRDGAAALPNGTNGIVLYNAPGNLIGGVVPGARNVISGNQRSGLYLFDLYGSSAGNRIEGNLIGTDLTGTTALPNTADGLTLINAKAVTVGGTDPGAGNVISGNGERGVLIKGAAGQCNVVQGNRIGTDAAGRQALGNQFSGIGVDQSVSNWIGGTVSAARNVISGNGQSGVHLLGFANGNRVQGNFLGVDDTGTNALGNASVGVNLENACHNDIGGSAPGAGNVIAGNLSYGVYVAGTGGSNVIAGNRIGTDATGTVALSNAMSGVRLESPANRIGGAAPGERNIISGNLEDGIWLAAGAHGNWIQGNAIGTDVTGAVALRNGRAGILLSSVASNLIGGAWAAEGNVISGNGDPSRADSGAGIHLIGAHAAGNVIQGNRIGTDAAGAARLSNYREGICMEGACSNLIGGPTPALGNVITSARVRGILMRDACGNVLQNNRIGTALDGVTDLGCGFHTVELENGCSHNVIGGGPGLGNTLAYARSVYAGVRVRQLCTNNLILNNAIFDNARLGIDLEPTAVNPNDACDADTGSNGKQNFPVLSTVCSGNGILIRGTLNSRPNLTCRVQFFSNPAPDAWSGTHGEGRTYLGETFVTTAADCTAEIEVVLPGSIPAGHWVTATATDPENNTSEFGPCVASTPMEVSATAAGGAGANLLALSWPAAASMFQLQETGSLLPPIQWTPVTNAPVSIADGTATVMVGTTNGMRFYRVSLVPLP